MHRGSVMPTTNLEFRNCSLRHSVGESVPRTTEAEKLAVLGQGASPRATLQRLLDYRRLFAYRYTGAVVTRVGQGPRAWTKLPKRLGTSNLVRHLLGDRIPGLDPVCFAARSFGPARWSCVDV